MELSLKSIFQERTIMRKFLFFVGVILLAFPVWAAAPQTDDQKALYALGAGVGKQLEVLNFSGRI
jgi:hypothetical protein